MHGRLIRAALLVGTAVTTGCGADDPAAPATVLVVPGAATMPTAPKTAEVAAGAEVTALGTHHGAVWAGTAEGVLAVSDKGVAPVQMADPGALEAGSSGAVGVMTRRQDGLLIATAGGLFVSVDGGLRVSPAGEAAGEGARALDDLGAGEAEEVWIADDDALHRIAGGVDQRWRVAGESGAPAAVRSLGDRVLVAYPGHVYELDVAAESAALVAIDVGRVHAVERGADGLAYLATDRGIFVRDRDGVYTRYTMADGEADVSVDALVADPSVGVYASTPEGIVSLRHGEGPLGVAALAAPRALRSMTVDDAGNPWVAEGDSLTSLAVGSPPSFEGDVKPLLLGKCAGCHAPGASSGGAPTIDFADYATIRDRADRIDERIAAAEMPPPPATPLGPEEYAVFSRWIRTGQEP